MKYHVIGGAVALLLLFPSTASAMTVGEISAKLQSIKAEIIALLEKVKQLDQELRVLEASLPAAAAALAAAPITGMPDLTVTEPAFSPDKDQYRASDSLEVSVKVTNKGTKESGPFTLAYSNRISGEMLRETEAQSLQPGESKTIQYRFSELSFAIPDINEITVTAVLKEGSDASSGDNQIGKTFFLATLPRSSGNGEGGGGGAGATVAFTAVEMTPGNDYYFKGPVTLQQIKDAGFMATGYLGNPKSQLFFMPHNPPEITDSPSETYNLWDHTLRTDNFVLPEGWSDGWIKTGAGPHGIDPSTLTSAYFIIRKDAYQNTSNTFTVPAGVTYFGSTPVNGSPRPW